MIDKKPTKLNLNEDKVKGRIMFIGNWFIAIGKRRSTFETCCRESLGSDRHE
jgi:hypothetical protein